MSRSRAASLALALSFVVAIGLATAPTARATDRDFKAVLTTGAYGIIGGTILGLASYPFTRNPRSIAIGTSTGLYLGIAVGIYYITNRDDPDNPLRNHEGRLQEESRLDPGNPPLSGPLGGGDRTLAETHFAIFHF